jgi:hypothetical protein
MPLSLCPTCTSAARSRTHPLLPALPVHPPNQRAPSPPQKKAKSESDATTCYVEAARCYKEGGNGKKAIELLESEAVPRLVDGGRLSQAAKLYQEVAEMLEDEGSFEDSITNYQKAADFFNAENAGSTAAKCLGKIALLAAKVSERARSAGGTEATSRQGEALHITIGWAGELAVFDSFPFPPSPRPSLSTLTLTLTPQTDPPDYARAAAMFEQVGSDNLSSNLMKFSAKSNFFNAVICVLARKDIVAAESALNKYKEMDYTFGGEFIILSFLFAGQGGLGMCLASESLTHTSHVFPSLSLPPRAGSRECKLLEDVCAAYKDGNTEAFTTALYNFNQISQLDPWRVGILLKVKNDIQASSAGGDVDLT